MWGELFEKRRKIMDDWSRFAIHGPADNVIRSVGFTAA
jgi:hypothetical protein